MRLEDINFKKLAHIDDKLLKEIIKNIPPKTNLEDICITINGIDYIFSKVKRNDWEDFGSYEYQEVEFLLCSSDVAFNIIDKFDVLAVQLAEREQSCCQEHLYKYENGRFYRITEAVMPERKVIRYVEVKNE